MEKKAIVFLLFMSLFPLICFFGYFFLQGLLDDRTDKEIYLDMRRGKYYSFKIDTIYRDEGNRYVLTMKGENEEDMATSEGIWENHFQVGDSIVKYKDSLQIYIYRNQKLDTILDYNDIWIRP